MTQKIQALLLPGVVLPARLAYPAVIAALGTEVDARYKELEIYATQTPEDGGFLDREVAGVLAFADAVGFERFHLVGYSAGGASALAFCAAHPERLVSLTLNEPAWIGRAGEGPVEAEFGRQVELAASLPPEERFPAWWVAAATRRTERWRNGWPTSSPTSGSRSIRNATTSTLRTGRSPRPSRTCC